MPASATADAVDSIADPATNQHPYPYFRRLRREDPVHFDTGVGMYVVSRHEDVSAALLNPLVFSSALGFESHRQDYEDEIDAMMTRDGFGPIPSVLTSDPPEHNRIRQLVDKAFTAHRVAAMEGYIDRIGHELIDAFVDRGQAEMLMDFAVPLPMWVIADQLGVDRGDLGRFRRWSDAAVAPLGRMLTRERAFECAREMIDLQHYLVARIEERRAERRDDMISDLVHAWIPDVEKPTLDQTELISIIRGLLVAGNETTTTAISNGVRLLAEQPNKFKEILDGPDQAKALFRMTEEILRIAAPVIGLPRVTTEDVTLGGTLIPKGSAVYLCYASANHDEQRFSDPETFLPRRGDVGRHLSFGSGIHRCIGAMLARMEIKCAMRALMTRITDLKLAVDEAELRYVPSIITHTLETLPIQFAKLDAVR